MKLHFKYMDFKLYLITFIFYRKWDYLLLRVHLIRAIFEIMVHNVYSLNLIHFCKINDNFYQMDMRTPKIQDYFIQTISGI